MYDKTKTWPFPSKKKQLFKKDALKFCQDFWVEEKRSKQFSFTKYNKAIIDAILYLAGDETDKYEAEKDALWFYGKMQSDTEEEFQEAFDQETESSVLNKMLNERDAILDKVIELCPKLADHEKLAKHKNIKLVLYKKFLERPDFVGEKERGYEKATLKNKVEQLYQDAGQKEMIPEFQENLLRTWQKQWEEGKGDEKAKKTGVARERMINGILQLCKELKKKEMFRRYGEEALNFYENKWEVKHVEMKSPEMKRLLCECKKLASSVGDRKRKEIYDEALQVRFFYFILLGLVYSHVGYIFLLNLQMLSTTFDLILCHAKWLVLLVFCFCTNVSCP